MRSRVGAGVVAGLVAGIAAPVVFWSLGLVVGLAWSGYDPIRQSISLLATAPLGGLQTLGFVLSGGLGIAWALALPFVLGATPLDRAVVRASQLLQAVIAIGFAVLPTDPTGAPITTIGRLHLADFYAYAISMPLTLLALGLVMRRDARWRSFARVTLAAAALMVVAILLVPATIDGPLTPWLGLLERVFVGIPSLWQVTTAIVALRLRP